MKLSIGNFIFLKKEEVGWNFIWWKGVWYVVVDDFMGDGRSGWWI